MSAPEFSPPPSLPAPPPVDVAAVEVRGASVGLERILRGPNGLGTASLHPAARREEPPYAADATGGARGRHPDPGPLPPPGAGARPRAGGGGQPQDQVLGAGRGRPVPRGLGGPVRRLLRGALHGRLPSGRPHRRPPDARHAADGRRERGGRLLLRGPRRLAHRPRRTPAAGAHRPRPVAHDEGVPAAVGGVAPLGRARGAPTAPPWSTSSARPAPPRPTGSGTTWPVCTWGTSPRPPGRRRTTCPRCGSTWRCASSTTSAPARPSPTPSAATNSRRTCMPGPTCSGSSRSPGTPPPS